MSRHPNGRAAALLLVLAAAAGLAGCGKTGALDRPGPLFGHAATKTRPADQQPQGQDPNRPITTVDPRDTSTQMAPPRAAPIQGTSPDPFGQPPNGSLPNPMSNPGQ